MKVLLKISRFDPDLDRSPSFQEFTVDVAGNQTVLDSLFLAWEKDPTLSFRRSCRSAICGSCAVSINGRPALACQTLFDKTFQEGASITIEPLPHFRQLKDLVVDLEPFFQSLRAVVPWLLLREDYDGRMSPEVAHKIEDSATCILCGICDAAQEQQKGLKPASLVKGFRFAQDPRDELGRHRVRLLQVPRAVLKLFVKELPDTCPKGIRIATDAV